MSELAQEVKNIPAKGKPVGLNVMSVFALVGAMLVPVTRLGDNMAFYLLGISMVLAIYHVGSLIVWHKKS